MPNGKTSRRNILSAVAAHSYSRGSRAASIAAIVCTSVVAVAAGIAVTVAVIDHKPGQIAESVAVAPSAIEVPADTITAKSDTARVSRMLR